MPDHFPPFRDGPPLPAGGPAAWASAMPGQARRAPPAPPAVMAWLAFYAGVTCVLLGSFLGSVGAFLFLAAWFGLAMLHAGWAARALTRTPWLWIFPGFAMLSMLWSQVPGDTMKFGLEYVASVCCAIWAARALTARQLLSSLLCCLITTAMLSVLFGRYEIDPLTETSAFVGVFESKNALGFFISLTILGGLASMLDGGQILMFRLLGVLGLALGAPLLAQTRSGTAEVTVVLACGVLLGNAMLSRMGPGMRAKLFAAALISLLPSVALFGAAGDTAQSFVVNVMGKDTTLTGRTLLWQRGAELIGRHPLLGHGFQAFWKQDTIEAESLWHDFHVMGRHGFHFHSTYVEAAVELGYLGGAVLVLFFLTVLGKLIAWSWRDKTLPASFFVATMICLLIRSFVEVDMLYQFQIGAFLLFVSACYATSSASPGKPLPAGQRAAGPLSTDQSRGGTL